MTQDTHVLFVPGVLSQLYDALSTFVLSGLDAAVRGQVEREPVVGGRIAAAMPRLGLPLAEGTGLSFYTQELKLAGLGIRCTNMGRPRIAGFDTQQGVQANGEAIKTKLEELRAQGARRVVIVSHSKGGLDTLAPAIERLAARIRIRSCYTSYKAESARTLIAAVAAGEDLAQALRVVGLMDGFNLAMSEPNDGLVPVSSTRLPGVVQMELRPSADHAAPVMLTAPLREFWTTANRDDLTLQLVSEVATS